MRNRSVHLWEASILICCFVIATGCRKNPTQPYKTPSALAITAATTSIFAGGSIQLAAIVTYNDGTNSDVTREVTWSISPGIAGSISTTGLFVATTGSFGVEVIRCDYKGQSTTKVIEVTKRALSLAIWPVVVNIEAGRSFQFEGIAEFQDVTVDYVTEKMTWRLDPGAAASIDSAGLLKTRLGAAGIEKIIGTYQSFTVENVVQIVPNFTSPFEMVTVPSNSFIMGDNTGSIDQRPAHQVFVDGFQIGKHEVTNAQYVDYLNQALERGEIIVSSGIVSGRKGAFAGIIYCRFLGTPAFPETFIEYDPNPADGNPFRVKPGFASYPVVRLSWYGAAAFCAYYGLRLPTEAEWEMASKGGNGLSYGTADGTLDHDLANFIGQGGRDSYDGLAPVGTFPPNPFGIYDLCGNAAEYVFDLYSADYYQNSPPRNPIGPGPAKPVGRLTDATASVPFTIWRGGAWIYDSKQCLSVYRGPIPDQAEQNFLVNAVVGFRVARSVL